MLLVMAALRDRLVEEHLHLVHSIAIKLKRRLGRTMEPGDMVGYGTRGLIEAANNYDPSLGAAFPTFANHRIRGASTTCRMATTTSAPPRTTSSAPPV